MRNGSDSAKDVSKLEKIFVEIQHVTEISMRVQSKSQAIHDSLLGESPKAEIDQEKTPVLGKLEVMSDHLSYIKDLLISADGLLSAVSKAVCK